MAAGESGPHKCIPTSTHGALGGVRGSAHVGGGGGSGGGGGGGAAEGSGGLAGGMAGGGAAC